MGLRILPGVKWMAGGCGHVAREDLLGALWPPGGWWGVGGRRRGDVCVCVADSLCCGAEASTPLWSNCAPVKVLKKPQLL